MTKEQYALLDEQLNINSTQSDSPWTNKDKYSLEMDGRLCDANVRQEKLVPSESSPPQSCAVLNCLRNRVSFEIKVLNSETIRSK